MLRRALRRSATYLRRPPQPGRPHLRARRIISGDERHRELIGSLLLYPPLLIIGALTTWSIVLSAELAGGMLVPATDLAFGWITNGAVDQAQHIIAALAAMRDPIDWLRPFAISTIDFPRGTTLFLNDAMPIVSLPLRALAGLGIELDPAIALYSLPLTLSVATPALMARFARTIGASRQAAFISGILTLTVLPAKIYLVSGWHGLACWPLLILLLNQLMAIGRSSITYQALLRVGLLSLLLLWSHGYLGVMAIALSAGTAVTMALRDRRALRPLLLLAASIAPAIVAVALGGLGSVSGADIMTGTWYPGSLAGLAYPAGPSGTEWIDWGFHIVIMLLVVLWVGRSRLGVVGLTSMLLVAYSLGSAGEAGGIWPVEMYNLVPFSSMTGTVDRFILPGVILACALTPSVLIDQVVRARQTPGRRGGRLLLLLIVLLSASITASHYKNNLGGFALINRLQEERADLPPPAAFQVGGMSFIDETVANAYMAVATERLVAQHSLVRIEQRLLCHPQIDLPHIDGRLSARVITLRMAYFAINNGRAIDSFYTSRRQASACLSAGDGSGEPSTLVVQYGGDIARELGAIRGLPDTLLCAQMPSRPLFAINEMPDQPIRFCSLQYQAIRSFAEETGARLAKPSEPWTDAH